MAVTVAAVLAAGALAGYGGGSGAADTRAAGAGSTAAGAAEASTQAAGDLPFTKQKLSTPTFSFSAELLQKNVYDPFMIATGCGLIVESGRNAERMTRIEESPANYDVVIIGDTFIADLTDADPVETVDNTELTNLDALYDVTKASFGEEYGPTYTFNHLEIVYDQAIAPVEVTKWERLWSPDLEGSIATPGITATTGPLFYYSVAKTMGLEPDEDDDAISAKLAELKPSVAKTYTSANGTITTLNRGEISAAVLLDYSYAAAKETSEDYIWVNPTEGSYSGYNTVSIVKDSENKELTEVFTDFYISKEVQLAEALDGVDSPVRKDVELTEEQSANFIYGADMIDDLLLSDQSVINVNKAD